MFKYQNTKFKYKVSIIKVMSRFFISSRQVVVPKFELQSKIKHWELLPSKDILAFDAFGGFIVWSFRETNILARGTLPSCPKKVKGFKNDIFIACFSETINVYNWMKADQPLAVLPLGTYIYIDSIHEINNGFILLSTNNQNAKRIFIYTGGDKFEKELEYIEQSRPQVTDYLGNGMFVCYHQHTLLDKLDNNFRFVVYDAVNNVSSVKNCEKQIPITIMKVCMMREGVYLIIGNLKIDCTQAYIYDETVPEKSLRGPIQISKNSFLDLLFYDPNLQQIGIATQIYDQSHSKHLLREGMDPQQYSCTLEIFDLQTKKSLNAIRIPKIQTQIRYLAQKHLFSVQESTPQKQQLKLRLYKFTHKSALYLKLLLNTRVEEKYGGDMLRNILGILNE